MVKKMARYEVELAPSNRTKCSSYNCGKKILRGQIRIKEKIGVYHTHPNYQYYCGECGIEELENAKENIKQLQDEIGRMVQRQ